MAQFSVDVVFFTPDIGIIHEGQWGLSLIHNYLELGIGMRQGYLNINSMWCLISFCYSNRNFSQQLFYTERHLFMGLWHVYPSTIQIPKRQKFNN